MRLAAVTAFVALLAVSPAHAQSTDDTTEFDPHSDSWDGMATWIGLAEGRGYTIDIKSELDWDQLGANDILVLVYPLVRVEPSDLSAFVQAGGNVLIADEQGESKDALTALGMMRVDFATPRATKYQDGRVWAPIASPRTNTMFRERVPV
jgi:hypothetical protein